MFVAPSKLDLPAKGEFLPIVEGFGNQTRPGAHYGYLDFSTACNRTTIGLDNPRWWMYVCGTQQTRHCPAKEGAFHDIVEEVIGDQTPPGADYGYPDFITGRNWTTIGLDNLRWWMHVCGTRQTRPARHRKLSSMTS